MSYKPTCLMILDGFGKAAAGEGNAISLARTPYLDRLFATCPQGTLQCSGLAVGLPDGQMGNSEVGHLNLGAGRVVYQELTRITREIELGDFFHHPVLRSAMQAVKESGKKLHLMGLLSDGGVHSHIRHLFALLEMAQAEGVETTCVHAFLDGRDTPPDSARGYVKELEDHLEKIQYGQLASLSGRYYAMDRDKRYDRLKTAYDCLTGGAVDGRSADEVLAASYADGVMDEFVIPTMLRENCHVEPGDGVIFFNFRPDRARELSGAFTEPVFEGFDRAFLIDNFCTMTQYDAKLSRVRVIYPPQELRDTLGETVAQAGLRQLRIAETEKYAHVTYFFSGGEEKEFQNEDRVLIPSPKVATYDLQPEMSAPAVAAEAVKRVESGNYDLIVLNFANPDMVGHTGSIPAAIQAVEAVDACVKQVVEAVLSVDGAVLLTADHGNADEMIDKNGGPMTAHSTNPVPVLLIGAGEKKLRDGSLQDVAPTVLDLMGLIKPQAMTGQSLLA